MTTSRWMLLGLFAVSTSAAVVAQRMPVPDSDGRALQLFDLKQIRVRRSVAQPERRRWAAHR